MKLDAKIELVHQIVAPSTVERRLIVKKVCNITPANTASFLKQEAIE